MPYEPKSLFADSISDLVRALEDELRAVSAEIAPVGDFGLAMPVTFREPEKRFRGQVVYADGTSWNPGSGEGLYRYTGAAWVFVG